MVVGVLFAVPAAAGQPAAAASLSWSTPAPFDLANGALSSVSCPSETLCVAVDESGNVATSTDPTGGASAWSAGHIDDDANDTPMGVSCASTSLCVAVDFAGNALRSTDPAGGASTWSAPVSVSADGLNGVSCSSTSLCVAVDAGGDVITSTNGGSSWGDPVLLGAVMTALSCPKDNLCVAIDANGNAWTSTDPTGDASKWTMTATGDDSAIPALSCVAGTQSCVAVDVSGQAISSTDGGSTWSTPATLSSNILTGVSCPSTSLCVAVSPAGEIWSSTDPTDASPTWSSVTLDAAGEPFAVSCPSESICVAVDLSGNALTATDPTGDASAWTTAEVDPGDGGSNDPISVSCASSSLCAAVDESGNVLASTDPAGGASTWTAPARINSGSSFWDVSCPTTSLCVAASADGNVFTSTNPAGGAAAWSSPISVSTAQLFGISCPSESLCVAVDQDGNVASSTDPTNPSAWNLDSVDATPIEAVDCASETFCVAVDGAGHAFTSTDPASGSWTSTTIAPGANAQTAVSCPSTSLCVVTEAGTLAGDIVTTTDPTGGASAWTLTNIDGNTGLDSLDCPSTGFCAVSDSEGNVLTSADPTGGESAWNTKFVDDDEVPSLSCPSAGMCVGVDFGGRVLVGFSTPSVTTGSAGSIGQTTATLTGTVNPNGLDVTDCHFSYGVGTPSGTDVPCSSSPGSGTSDVPVSAQLSGLTPGTGYQFRLVAKTAGGTELGSTGNFTTTAPNFTLTVAKSGNGTGTVTSSPAGIDCGATCSHAYAQGTVVTLTAAPANGVFDGWSGGGCSGFGTCTVTMTSDTTVTASFIIGTQPPPAKCVVPKVKGKTLKAAKRAIKAHHCATGKVRHAASRKVKKGHVISQKPKPGKKLKRGAKVSLVVSKGRR